MKDHPLPFSTALNKKRNIPMTHGMALHRIPEGYPSFLTQRGISQKYHDCATKKLPVLAPIRANQPLFFSGYAYEIKP
jgi:deoxyxylulose-5-phosphate synthase